MNVNNAITYRFRAIETRYYVVAYTNPEAKYFLLLISIFYNVLKETV